MVSIERGRILNLGSPSEIESKVQDATNLTKGIV
jgi:hypothetical protein